MGKRFWWVGLGFGLLASAAGCSEVDNCKDGQEGCIGGKCRANNVCRFDLECRMLDDGGDLICGAKLDDGTFDCGSKGACSRPAPGGGDGDGDGDGDVEQCACQEEGELCIPGSPTTCVNYCEVPDVIPGSIRSPGSCEQDNFAAACEALCRQICVRDEVFCGLTCDPDNCGGAAIQQICEEEFAGSLEDVIAACVEIRDSACEDYECFEGALDCNGVVCSNDCAGGEYNFDGDCDDGDFSNGDYGVCAWGTDCGDCGPRKGTAPPRRYPIGSPCLSDSQCAGYSADITLNQAWCLKVEGLVVDHPDGLLRCMPDCSGKDETCPEGYTCAGLTVGGQPYEMNGIQAHACTPAMCQ